jgi:hypothetical protein
VRDPHGDTRIVRADIDRHAVAQLSSLELVLDPAKSCLWSARPSQRLLVADDSVQMLIGLALFG